MGQTMNMQMQMADDDRREAKNSRQRGA